MHPLTSTKKPLVQYNLSFGIDGAYGMTRKVLASLAPLLISF